MYIQLVDEKEVISLGEKPFKDREEVKAEMEKFFAVGLFDSILGVIFAIIGVAADALDVTLVLEPMSWFLLAIFFAVLGVWPVVKSTFAKSLYGIESENKPE